MGYHDSVSLKRKKGNHEDKVMMSNKQLIEQTMEMVRKQIERIDFYMGTMMMGSLGGGTGSGLTSRLVEVP